MFMLICDLHCLTPRLILFQLFKPVFKSVSDDNKTGEKYKAFPFDILWRVYNINPSNIQLISSKRLWNHVSATMKTIYQLKYIYWQLLKKEWLIMSNFFFWQNVFNIYKSVNKYLLVRKGMCRIAFLTLIYKLM